MKYKKVNSELSGKIVLFGCGVSGKKCYQYLMNHNCEIFAVCDNSLDKIDTKFFEHTICSIDDVIKKSPYDFTVIIAIKAYESVYKQLRELNVSNIILYTERGMFSLEDFDQDIETLTKTITDKTIYIAGDDKYVEDFMYIFRDIKAKRTKIIPELKTDTFVIVCKLYDEDVIIEELEKKGYRKGIDYVEGAAFVQLLDGNKAKSSDSPSLLMMQTVYDTMKEQKVCTKAFNSINISSGFNMHCCCPDWSMPFGNVEFESLENVWNSIVAKIFRLSLINRTYTFCSIERCVELKVKYDNTTQRLNPIPRTEEIPQLVELSIDKTCNLYCASCRSKVCVESGAKRERIEAVKNKIIQSGWLEKSGHLLLGGQGEVFFSPTYKSILFDATSKREFVHVRTNGTLMTAENLQRMVDLYKKICISVSIDAVTKETYNRLRRNDNIHTWENLCNNMEVLAKFKKEKKIETFTMSMCVQMDNYLEMPAFIQWGERLGADSINLAPIRNWGTYTDEEFCDVSIMDENKRLKPAVSELLLNSMFNKDIVHLLF